MDVEIFHDTKLQGLQLLQVSPHSLPPPLVSKSLKKKKKKKKTAKEKKEGNDSPPFPYLLE